MKYHYIILSLLFVSSCGHQVKFDAEGQYMISESGISNNLYFMSYNVPSGNFEMEAEDYFSARAKKKCGSNNIFVTSFYVRNSTSDTLLPSGGINYIPIKNITRRASGGFYCNPTKNQVSMEKERAIKSKQLTIENEVNCEDIIPIGIESTKYYELRCQEESFQF